MKRKTLLILLLAFISSHLVNAQIKKGSLLLGGQFSFSTNKSKTENENNDRTQTGFNISPAIGKAIKDNLIAGFDLVYSHSKDKTDNNLAATIKNNGYGAGFFIRQYLPVLDRLYLFAQGRMGGFYSKYENYTSASSFYNTKEFNVSVGFYPGISFAVNKKIHLESGFSNLVYAGFTHKKIEESNGITAKTHESDNFGIGSSLENQSGFTIGVRVLLAK